MNIENNFKINGEFYWEEVDSQNNIIVSSSKKHNIILNKGIDLLSQFSFAECILNVALGDGAIPPLYTDLGLSNEVYRTNQVDTSVKNPCGSYLIGNIYTIYKTFKTNIVPQPVTFREIGWSPYDGDGNYLFSKSLLFSADHLSNQITIQPGHFLRIYYYINITLSPSTIQTGQFDITGWSNTNGSSMIQLIGLRSLNADGTLGYFDAGNDCNEPSGNSEIFIGESSDSLSLFGLSTNRSGSTNYKMTATNIYAGNGKLYKRILFKSFDAINSNLNSVGIGVIGSSETNSGFVFVFDNQQVKQIDSFLTLNFIYNFAHA